MVIQKSNQFQFKWIHKKHQLVYKIKLSVEENISGLLSIEDIPKELRLHISLIEISLSNRGKQKEYDRIAGCLIAFTCQLSFAKNYEGFVSLDSKTELIDWYKQKYGFKELGRTIYTELANSEELIKKVSQQ